MNFAAPQTVRPTSVTHFSTHHRTHVHREKPLQVMKFGGTSVGNASMIDKVLKIVGGGQRNHAVLVVVSAMAGVTDLLIEAGGRAAAGDAFGPVMIFAGLREKHRSAAEALLPSRDERERYGKKIQECLAEGEQLCQEILRTGELTANRRDFLSSLGERLCAPLLAAALRECGLAAEAVDARECLVTDSRHGAANPLRKLTRERCETRLRFLLQAGVVPVVTGFLGATVEGVLTTLGRGGSDYSASILAAALDAQELIIWTDVNGFLTSDPDLVPDARTIPQISYRQAAALAYFGAKVLHPKTLQPVMQRGIPVWVRNTFFPEHAGTKITLDGPDQDSVKALAAMKDLSLITVAVSSVEPVLSVKRRAFASVSAAHGDMVLTVRTPSAREFGLLVRASLAEISMDALRREFGASGPGECEFGMKRGVSLVTLVSQNLRDLSSFAKQAFEVLRSANLEVFAGSQSASGCNISIVVASEDTAKTLVRLHRKFRLETPNPAFRPAD